MTTFLAHKIKPRIFMRRGRWWLDFNDWIAPLTFKSIRHLQDFVRTGRL